MAEREPLDQNKALVVLLHGLGRTKWSMNRLENRLKDEGFSTVNLTYPSLLRSIDSLAEGFLIRKLSPHLSSAGGPVHFVTHSWAESLFAVISRIIPFPRAAGW